MSTNNFGVVEIASTRTTTAPGWAYVPDTGGPAPREYVPGVLQTAGRKRTAAAAGRAGGAGTVADASSRREAKIQKEIEALDRENPRDVAIPVPAPAGASQTQGQGSSNARSSRGPGKTANTRKILQSQKTFANHLDDFDAMLSFIEQNPGPASAAAVANLAAYSGKDGPPPAAPTPPPPAPAEKESELSTTLIVTAPTRKLNALQRRAAAEAEAAAAASKSKKGKQAAASQAGRGALAKGKAPAVTDQDGDTAMTDGNEEAADGIAAQPRQPPDPWAVLFPEPSSILAPLPLPPAPQKPAPEQESWAATGDAVPPTTGSGTARCATGEAEQQPESQVQPHPRLTAPTPHPLDGDPLLASWIPPLLSDAELRALLSQPALNYHEARARFAPPEGEDADHEPESTPAPAAAQGQKSGKGKGAGASETSTGANLASHDYVPPGLVVVKPGRGAPNRYPPRYFCEVCGYWGRVRCTKCGARVCALDCLEVHREECLARYGL